MTHGFAEKISSITAAALSQKELHGIVNVLREIAERLTPAVVSCGKLTSGRTWKAARPPEIYMFLPVGSAMKSSCLSKNYRRKNQETEGQ